MKYKSFINGNFVSRDKLQISAQDTGFLFGYGIFETLRSYQGFFYRLKEHIDRLARSARFFNIPLPFSCNEIPDIIQTTAEQNNLKNAYIKIILSGGTYSGKLTSPTTTPTFIVHTLPFKPYPESWYKQGVKATVSRIKREPSSPIYTHKTLNYLENVLAQKEAQEKGVQEALFLNTRNYLTEGSITNLFVVKKGEVMTPPVSSGILPGITRKVVINLCAKEGIPCTEERINLKDLFGADEAFLTNSLREILPLAQIESRYIGEERGGRITKILRKKYRENISLMQQTGQAG